MPKRKRKLSRPTSSNPALTPSPRPMMQSVRAKSVEIPPSKRRKPYALAPQTGTHILFLFVGETHTLLTLHTNLLPPASQEYLTTRFSAQQMCWLSEEDPSIANLWRQYLYTGYVFSHDEAADQDAPDSGDEESHTDGEWTKLAHAYLFGRKVHDEGFASACVTALIEKVQETERFPTGIASEVYLYTAPGDKLRELLVDLHVWVGQGECLKPPHEDAEAPMEFHRHVRRELRRAGDAVYGETVGLWETDRCAYHTHDSTAVCQG